MAETEDSGFGTAGQHFGDMIRAELFTAASDTRQDLLGQRQGIIGDRQVAQADIAGLTISGQLLAEVPYQLAMSTGQRRAVVQHLPE